MTLRVSDLRVHYRTLAGDVKALDGVTFAVDDVEIMGLAGESGCGKSTLGNSLILLGGRMRFIGGEVERDGKRLPIDDSDAMNEFRFREVSIIPQYAMSAMNPTRKSDIEAELAARGRSRPDRCLYHETYPVGSQAGSNGSQPALVEAEVDHLVGCFGLDGDGVCD